MKRLIRASALVLPALALALCGSWFAPHPIDDPQAAPYSGPSGELPFGTDQLGRDVLSRVLAGGLHLVVTATVIAAIVTLGAALLGSAAALRPRLGVLVDRTADLFMLIPAVLAILLVALSWPGGGDLALGLTVVTISLPFATRVVAGAAAPLARTGYVQAAVAGGERLPYLILRELLPNLRGTLTTLFGLRFVEAVYVVTAAGFLQIGPQPPAADWALMVRENAPGMLLNPWSVLAPSLAVGLLAISVNLAADLAAHPPGGGSPRRRSRKPAESAEPGESR
ncbi:ABC transporter permease [Embleya sp. AB8]|uniref:ABC transporter permease n=1 Tax=Embleya sp. AB8 TaxID=3156304 RepID=UPI003C76B8F7